MPRTALPARASLALSRGFTLVEWLIVISIGLFITAGITTVLVGSQSNMDTKSQLAYLEENGRIAMHFITEDLRHAGFWGDFTGNILQAGPNLELPDIENNQCRNLFHQTFPPRSTIEGYSDIFSYSVPVTMTDCSFSLPGSLIDGTDVLSLVRASTEPLPSDLPTDPNRYYIETNTAKAVIFRGSATSAIARLPQSRTWEYIRHIYYLLEDYQTGIPMLYRAHLEPGGIQIPDSPLAEGIEQMRFLFSVDKTNDGVADMLVPASNVAEDEWVNGRVIGARIYLLVRALEENKSRYKNTNTYHLGDISYTVNDGYRRVLLTSAITLPNPHHRLLERIPK